MDFTMNNQTLDDLVKRDKKLGRVAGGKANKPQANGKGKRPNRMQQQRNQVAAVKQNKQNNNKGGQKQQQQQRPQQQMQQRIKGRGASIFKQKNAQGQQRAGNVVRTAKGQGRVMTNSVTNKRQQAGKKGQQQGNNQRQEVGNRRRQLLTKKLQGNRRQNNNQLSGRKMQPVVKYTPQKQQKQQPANQKQASAQVVPQGTLSARKIKVRNIDANAVTVADLQKLFQNCGALISAGFDKNMNGQYLGSATLIYVKSTSAANAIKRYNGAQLDDRVMKIEYAMPKETPRSNSSPMAKKPQRLQVVKKPLGVRRGNNAIQKRGGANNAQKSGNAQKAGAGKVRRGLGAKRSTGKTLSLTPANKRRSKAQAQKSRR